MSSEEKSLKFSRQFSIKLTTPDKDCPLEIINIKQTDESLEDSGSATVVTSAAPLSHEHDVDVSSVLPSVNEEGINQERKEILSIFMEPSCVYRINELKRIIERSVAHPEYRHRLASSKETVNDLCRVIKEYWKNAAVLYATITQEGSSNRMDTGWQDVTAVKRVFVLRWAVVLRILNLFKNLLVERETDIQETLYSSRILYQLLKKIPRVTLSKYLATEEGQTLFTGSQDVGLNVALLVCVRADATIVAFILNSIAANQRMQDLHRAQIWPGAFCVLAMWTQKSDRTNIRRYGRDVIHLGYLLHALFANCEDAQLTCYFDLEPSGMLKSEDDGCFCKSVISRTLSRAFSSLTSDTLDVNFSSNISDAPNASCMRDDMVYGALIEPQVSAVVGRGVNIARKNSFVQLNQRSGSYGFDGRDALFIAMCVIHEARTILQEAAQNDPVHGSASLDEVDYCIKLLTSSCFGRANCAMMLHLLNSFNYIKAVPRILKAAAHNRGEAEDDVRTKMSKSAVDSLNSLLKNCGVQAELTMDDEQRHLHSMKAVNATTTALRTCVGDLIGKQFVVEALICDEKSILFEYKEPLMKLLLSSVVTEEDQYLTVLSNMITSGFNYEVTTINSSRPDLLREASLSAMADFLLTSNNDCQLTTEMLMLITCALWNCRGPRWAELDIERFAHLVTMAVLVPTFYLTILSEFNQEDDRKYVLILSGLDLKTCISTINATIHFIKVNRAEVSKSGIDLVIEKVRTVVEQYKLMATIDQISNEEGLAEEVEESIKLLQMVIQEN